MQIQETFVRYAAHVLATETTLVTVPADTTIVLTTAQATNLTSAPVTINLIIKLGGTNPFYLAQDVLLDPDEPLNLLAGKVTMTAGDTLVAVAAAPNQVDVYASALSITEVS
jgi:uncharacterized caspase-like protein